MKKVLGFGAALVDLLVHVEEERIQKANVPKGSMNLVKYPQLLKLLDGVQNPQRFRADRPATRWSASRSSAASPLSFSKTGRDELGVLLRSIWKNSGVENHLLLSSTATGTVLSAVTPDAERTMFTFLGASDEVSAADISPELFDGVGILYLEGYRAYGEECFAKMVSEARRRGVMTALDFGSFGVVNDCRSFFNKLFAGKEIDIVIANEEEAKAYTGECEEAALAKMAQFASIAVVKLGKRGALISQNGKITRVEAGSAKAIDTTGAGDLWASGFLYGLLSGWSMERAGILGSMVSNEVVQVVGAQIPEEGWERIRKEMGNV